MNTQQLISAELIYIYTFIKQRMGLLGVDVQECVVLWKEYQLTVYIRLKHKHY